MSVQSIFYKKRTKVLPFLTGVAGLTNIALNLYWIPRYGMMGAAYATLVSYFLLFLLAHFAAQYFYRIPYNYRKMLCIGVLVGGIFIVNNLLAFEGILIPVAIKGGLLAAFISGLLLSKVITLRELRSIRRLVKMRETKGA